MKRIILASTSPRRKELLSKAGLIFDAMPCNYEEDMSLPLPPPELAMYLALGKAMSVADQVHDALVISADTFIALDGTVLGKPKTLARAGEMIRAMNGKSHSIITGYAIVDTDSEKMITNVIETKIFFKQLSEQEIENYLAVSDALDRAGAYAIQDHGGTMLVERYEGDLANAMGLPVTAVLETLKQFDNKYSP